MSYWVNLLKNKEENCPFELPERHVEGSGVDIGGSFFTELRITWLYRDFFNFYQLNNVKAENSIKILEEAVQKLGTNKDADYWAKTPGNAGHACSILLEWAKKFPTGIWEVR